jgi:hypothetical protein
MSIIQAPQEVRVQKLTPVYRELSLAEAEARVNKAVTGLRLNDEAYVTFHSGELSRYVAMDLEASCRAAGYSVYQETGSGYSRIWKIGSGTTPSMVSAYYNK